MPISEELRAQGWIEHDGGPCPVPLGTRVEVLYRGGKQATINVSFGFGWKYIGYLPRKDIIAYKLETPDA